MKQCLADFRKSLPWVERLDLTNPPAEDVFSQVIGKVENPTNGDVNADDDFQREMFLYVTMTWHQPTLILYFGLNLLIQFTFTL